MAVAPSTLTLPKGAKPAGLNDEIDEKIFGAAFDGRVISRFVKFLKPYYKGMIAVFFAVILFTVTQLAVPLVIRYAIDHALIPGATDRRLLETAVLAFTAIITLNALASYTQEVIIGRTTERVLFDLRRAMYVHLQNLSMSF